MRRLLAVIALAAACTPGPDIDPSVHNTYLVYDWNSDSRSYVLHPSTINTLVDPGSISGAAAELRGGGSLLIRNASPQTKEEFANAIEVRHDRTPRAEYFVDRGVVVPYDFDTEMMVTLYHHLERASEYFGALGVEPIGRLPTYYFPQIALFGIQLPLLTDNAAYAMTLDAFLIPPTVRLDEGVPLSANRGVIVHEYSHAVFNRVVFRDDRAPAMLWDASFSESAAEQLRSLDEGVADTFAALALDDPDFISPSISGAAFELDRDLRFERTWDRELQSEIDASAMPNPYLLGSVVASCLWAMREFLDDTEIAENTLRAMEAIAVPDGGFTLAVFINAWLSEVDDVNTVGACDVFTSRLVLIRDDLNCP